MSKSSAIVSCTIPYEQDYYVSTQDTWAGTITDQAPEGMDSDEENIEDTENLIGNDSDNRYTEDKTNDKDTSTLDQDQCSYQWWPWALGTLIVVAILAFLLKPLLLAALALTPIVTWYFIEKCHLYWWAPTIIVLAALIRIAYVYLVKREK